MYMTYRPGGRNATKMHDASQYSGNFPESVDWRTNNAVTSIKDQVLLAYCIGSNFTLYSLLPHPLNCMHYSVLILLYDCYVYFPLGLLWS